MYEELALPLTNSRGFGRFIRFDYKVEHILDMPLVVSPHILSMGNPYYSRQALYFLEDVDCVIRMWTESPSSNSGDENEWRKTSYRKLERAADDCLFEYSLRNFSSKLTTRSDRKLLPQSTRRIFLRSFPGTEDKYIDIDNGNAGLVYPIGAQQFDDIYERYVGLVASVFDAPDDVDENFGWFPEMPLSISYPDSFKFYKTPYTFDQLETLGRMIPADPKLLDRPLELSSAAIAREAYLGLFNQQHVDKIQDFPPDRFPEQEIIAVSRTFNPILLDFYFAGLSSLSPIVEFRNYYSVVEYFFEDATFSNFMANLSEVLDGLLLIDNFGDYESQIRKLQVPSDENSQIKEVIKKYVSPDRLDVFFNDKIPKATKVHFMTYRETVSDRPVQCIKGNSADIQQVVASRIYQFRNAIFHAKRTRKGKETLHFRPGTDAETNVIEHEALLLRFVAQEIIRQADIDV